jgi:hypothetical protein
MTGRALEVRPALCGLLAALACAGGAAAADRLPRTPSGAPDLQGLWTNASLTTLERPAGFAALVIPEAEAKAFEAAHDGIPSVVGGDVGQGETEWWELGATLARIDGQVRTSWVTDPADGRLPYSPEGRRNLQAGQAMGMSNFDGPEVRPAPERCLAGVGGTNAPPMLNTGYNNHLQIVQTPQHVVIVTEMNHDARIIPLKPEPAPPGASWLGHSVGRWEGDTLVVETTGFHPGSAWRTPSPLYISPAGLVTERFTRVSRDEIRYAFSVEDPTTYSRPWRAEMPLKATPGPMYEFACHEGNYSLSGVLAGGRQKEREAQAAGTPK